MKIVKWVAFVVTLLLGVSGVSIYLIPWISIGFSKPEAASIGIIGGADGPTSIFVAGKTHPFLFGIGHLVLFVGAAIMWLWSRHKTKYKP